MGTTDETIPAGIAYLAAPEDAAARWRERFGKGKGRKIGLVWSGNPKHANDHHRSCRLADMALLAGIEGGHFYALQISEAAAQADAPPDGMAIERLDGKLGDFTELAGAISALDLIVTVDTAPAHLAGALGRPVLDRSALLARLALATGAGRQPLVSRHAPVPSGQPRPTGPACSSG